MASSRFRTWGQAWGQGPAGQSPQAQPVPSPGLWLGSTSWLPACPRAEAEEQGREGAAVAQTLTCDHMPLSLLSHTPP